MATLFLRKKLPFFSSSFSSHHLSSTLAPKSLSSSSSSNFMAEYLITSCGFSQERAAKSSRGSPTSPPLPSPTPSCISSNTTASPPPRSEPSYPTTPTSSSATPGGPWSPTSAPSATWASPTTTSASSSPATPRPSSSPPSSPASSSGGTSSAEATRRGSLPPSRETWASSARTSIKGSPLRLLSSRSAAFRRPASRGVVVRGQGLFRNSLSTIASLLKRVEGFGFPRGSPMFALALLALGGVKSDTLKAKMKLYRSFGWSDGELISAIKKFPFIVRLSEENVRAKMPFLVQKAGCTPGYIARYPFMLAFSLEKRLFPRHRVMQILTSNKLLVKVHGFYPIMRLTEKEFLETVVVPHNDKLPTLLETYIAACAGKNTT